jgi:hypothetical protein
MHSRFGDDRTPVGVAKENDIAIDSVENGDDASCITMQVGKGTGVVAVAWEIYRDGGNICGSQERHHPLKAPRTVPSAVNKNNRCRHR